MSVPRVCKSTKQHRGVKFTIYNSQNFCSQWCVDEECVSSTDAPTASGMYIKHHRN